MTLVPVDRPTLINEQLDAAIRRGDLGNVRECLDRGANLDYHDALRPNPVMQATASGHLAVLAELLSRGAPVNGVWRRLRALNWAHEPAVRDLLLAHGARKADPMVEEMDRSFLSRALGYEVPIAFADRLNQIIGAAQDAAIGDLIDVVGFNIEIREGRYQNTPAEMFPFGWTGSDGCHFGHIIHAPELGRSDFPIGFMDPYTDGPSWYGDDSLQGLNNCLTSQFEDESLDSLPRGILNRTISRLGFSPKEWGKKQIFADINGKPVVPATHPGYVHVPNSDQVGVFAPVDSFSASDSAHPAYRHQDSDRLFAYSRECLPRHPATALYVLKELWAHFYRVEEVAKLMADCYRLLGREILIPNITIVKLPT
jgi:hypothetical protein